MSDNTNLRSIVQATPSDLAQEEREKLYDAQQARLQKAVEKKGLPGAPKPDDSTWPVVDNRSTRWAWRDKTKAPRPIPSSGTLFLGWQADDITHAHLCQACSRYLKACDCPVGQENDYDEEFCNARCASLFARNKHLYMAQCENRCRDCKSPHPVKAFFMVQSALWRKYGVDAEYNWEGNRWNGKIEGNRRGLLCFFCFEKRLGRRLRDRDLKANVRCNLYWRRYLAQRPRKNAKRRQEFLTEPRLQLSHDRPLQTLLIDAPEVRKAVKRRRKPLSTKALMRKYGADIERGKQLAMQFGDPSGVKKLTVGIVVPKPEETQHV